MAMTTVGVRFDNGPKLHYVEVPGDLPARDTHCVVTTRRGPEIARVRTDATDDARPQGQFVRIATEADMEQYELLRQKAENMKWLLRARARQRGLKLKLVSVEFNLDETMVVVNYTSEDQAPLRPLAQELASHTKARVEFANIGPRDQARILGTIGSCGAGSCSSTWLQSFSAVSIRMARDQQLPLNPEKISGPCGRLLCCLQYEHEMYKELLRGMPKKGAKACHTGSGTCGRITKLNPLKGTVEIRAEDGAHHEFPATEVERMRG